MALSQDLRQALRLLRKAPWFTLASVVVLALGIGATTAIFSLVDAALLRPLPYRDSHRLVLVSERSPNTPRSGVSMGSFFDWKQRNRTFSDMAGSVSVVPLPVSDGSGIPESVSLQTVTSTFFEVLGVTPILGRTFSAQDDVTVGGTGRPGIGFVMGEGLWRRRFASDPTIVGKTVSIGSPPRAVPVIGVVPSSFQVFGTTDLWEHIPITSAEGGRGARVLRVIARLKPEATIEQSRADIEGIARNIEQEFPITNKGWGAVLEPLQPALVGSDLRRTSLVLGGVVLFVLLLACANVANLILARGVGRTREIAVRAALGGTQARITRQLLTETAALGVIGGAVGLALAWALLRIAPALVPAQTLPVGIALGIDWRLATFAVVVTCATTMLCGLAPAWQAARVPLAEAMNAGGRGSSDRAGRIRQGLAVLEIAVALMLVTGAGLLVRTLVSLNGVDAGYRADRVVTMSIRLPFRRLIGAAPGALGRYWKSIEDGVAGVPGVRAAALSSDVPMGGLRYRQLFTVVGGPAVDPANRPSAQLQIISPAYFDTLAIPLIQGRSFTERDAHDGVQVAIVNQEFARRHLGGRDPIGERIVVQSLTFPVTQVTREVVGVVGEVKTRPDAPSENALQIYIPIAQNDWMETKLVLRTDGDPLRLVSQIQAAVARADPTQAVAQVQTMEQVEAEATARPRFRAQLVVSFAVLATTLAAIGIFSVLMFMVQQRAREFSLRLALGASAGDVLGLVVGGGLRLTAIGVAIGVVISAALARSLATLLFGVAPLDPMTFIAAPLALTIVSLTACLVPALRALRADPVAALRAE